MMDRPSSAPTDEAAAERAVARYRSLSPAERWQALTDLLREMESVVGPRMDRVRDEHPFWRHWTDPFVGIAV